jgi:hypothetical protein
MLIPEQQTPTLPKFSTTALTRPLEGWQKISWETPFSALPIQTLRRLAAAASGTPEAFD